MLLRCVVTNIRILIPPLSQQGGCQIVWPGLSGTKGADSVALFSPRKTDRPSACPNSLQTCTVVVEQVPYERMRLKAMFAWGASIALGVTAVLFGFQQPAAELKVGDVAPAFDLQGSDGKTYKLADFKGKRAVVLAWFPKAFTGG
jgi:hypothetical protein